MMDALLQDDSLRLELARLSGFMQAMMPPSELSERYPFFGEDPLSMGEAMGLMERLQQMDRLESQLERGSFRLDDVDRSLAEQVLASAEMRRLLTLPGVNFVTAAALIAAIGDIGRFPTSRQLVSYLGLDPRVSQSGAEPARHGRISKQGPGETRHVLVEAAWHASRAPGPLRAFHQRVAARRGGNIATVAVARKLAVIAWHMLSRGEDYAFARPSLTREKLRRLELMTGAEHQKGKRIGVFASKEQHDLDKQLAAQAELAYRRLVQDWQPTIKGTGAAPGRASRRPSSGQAARQETAPPPAL
jgi:hypothetical protein